MNIQKEHLLEKNDKELMNNGRLNIQPAQPAESGYLKNIFNEVQELLKDVKSSFAEDIVAERKM
ncbi:MAG: hypothetical protein JWQ09_5681 [Segetibacter sp.]|nr:hypothetical protein [Segetibacter sp.]